MWCAFALPNVFWALYLFGRLRSWLLHLWLRRQLAMHVAMPVRNVWAPNFSMGINQCDKRGRYDQESFHSQSPIRRTGPRPPARGDI